MANITFVSLGCDKNLVDTEIMLGLIESDGHKLIDNAKEADVIIINTCGFIMDATKEGIDQILQLASYKERGICKALIVTGCMAQRYKDEIFEEMPEVDAVVGTTLFHTIGEVIKEVLAGTIRLKKVGNKDDDIEDLLHLRRKIEKGKHFAYLKIAEGCDKHCTYCTIPSIRGRYRSRKQEVIIEEAKLLVDAGVKEIILVAQDTTLYGTDLYKAKKLPELLEELCKIEELKWIRILYAYPEHIDDKIIDVMANNEKICNYIDMPIQHSHSDILKRMGRTTTTEKLKDKILELRKAMPDIVIRTTIMVGFPGEEEEHFEHMLRFIEEIKFDKLGVFSYSLEEGTKASEFLDQVKEYKKENRKHAIMEKQQQISKLNLQKYVKTKIIAMVDKKNEEGVYTARGYMDSHDIDGLIFVDSQEVLVPGDFIEVLITHSTEYDLIGIVDSVHYSKV